MVQLQLLRQRQRQRQLNGVYKSSLILYCLEADASVLRRINMNFQTICRVCIEANSEMVSIFESYNFSPHSCEIYKVITDCASVQIQKLDGFSQHICRRCLNHLMEAYSFKKLCEDSDYKFRNNLLAPKDGIEVKTEFVEDINYGEINNELRGNTDKKSKMFELELTQVKTEPSDDEIKTKYELDNNPDGIQAQVETYSPFERVDCKEESQCTKNDANCKFQISVGNSDLSHHCEHCSKPTKEYFALHIKEQPYKHSDLKFSSDLIASDEIRIKNEFIEENTRINYGEAHNVIVENSDFKLIEVVEAQTINEEKSDNDHDEIGFTGLDIMEYNAHCIKKIRSGGNECELCNKVLPTKRSMDLHMKAHAGHELHKCKVCSKEFLKSRYLAQHMKMHEGPVERAAKSKTKKSFICEICGRHFQHKHRLMEHIVSHTGEKPYKCKLCDKKFTHKYELVIHAKVHTDVKPHKCNVCDKTFIRKTYLVNHSRLHSGEKPHKCDICNKKFSRKHHLVSHIRSHTGEKPYACSVCEKKFAEKSDLNQHIGRLHTGEKLKCDFCDQQFTQSCGLASHIKTHGEEKPYKCDSCDRRFSKKGYLIMHTRFHTEEKFL